MEEVLDESGLGLGRRAAQHVGHHDGLDVDDLAVGLHALEHAVQHLRQRRLGGGLVHRGAAHEEDVVAVKDVEVVPDTEAVKEAELEHDAAVYALTREAAITGDTHIEVDGEVIPLVPEDMITEQDKVHADPAPTHRPNKEVKIKATKK